MYRKNTATQYIYFGLINATSGAALTGATVTAYRALDGNAQASATGTTTELGNGQYRFNLSQADTNANNGSYLFTATNAIPVEKTVVFTAADPTDATAFGISRMDAAITSRMATFTLPTNFSSLAITAGGAVTAGTVSDKTGYSLSQAFPTNFASMAITAGGSVTAGTVSDKTGYSLASGGLASVTAWTVAITGNITGNLSGSVGSVTTGVTVSTNNDKTGYSLSQAFPSNFSSLAISAGTGAVTVNGDTFGNTFVITNLATQTSVNTLIGYVDTEVAAIKAKTDLIPADIGSVLVAANVNQRTVSVTGSNHVAADVHEFQPGVITAADFAAGAIDANALAADAATEVANAVAATQALSRLDSMIESDGSGQFRFDTIALSMAPAGGGGGGTDWTSDERTAIRSILGVPTSGTTPTDPSVGILDTIRDKTNLITTGTIQSSIAVTASGQINGPLIIGDDYLAANGRAFQWTVALPSGYVLGTSTCKFGMSYSDETGSYSFIATGTVTDAGSGNVLLSFDVPKSTTSALAAGWYRWSAEIANASGTEITRVASSANKLVEWKEKQT